MQPGLSLYQEPFVEKQTYNTALASDSDAPDSKIRNPPLRTRVAPVGIETQRAAEMILETSYLDYAMPCHAMLCYAMPCHAMPCHAMLCYALLYDTIRYDTIRYDTIRMLCYTVIDHAVLYHHYTVLYHTILYHTIPYGLAVASLIGFGFTWPFWIAWPCVTLSMV